MVKYLEKPKKKTKKPKKSAKKTKSQHVYVHVKNETGGTGARVGAGMGSMGSVGPHYAIASPLRPQESTLTSKVDNLTALFKPRMLSKEEALEEREMRHYHNEASARGLLSARDEPQGPLSARARVPPFRFAGMRPGEAVKFAEKAQLGDDNREQSINKLRLNQQILDAHALKMSRKRGPYGARQKKVVGIGVRESNAEMSEAGNIGINGHNSTKIPATDGDRFAEGSSGRNVGITKSTQTKVYLNATPIEKAVSGEPVGAESTRIPASGSHATDLAVEDLANEETGVELVGGIEHGVSPFIASAGASAGLSVGQVKQSRSVDKLRALTSESKPPPTSKPGKKSAKLPSLGNDPLGNTVGAEARIQFVGKAEPKKGNDLEADDSDEYPGDREA